MKRKLLISGLTFSFLAGSFYSSVSASHTPLHEEDITIAVQTEETGKAEPMFWAFVAQQAGKQVGKYLGRQLIGSEEAAESIDYELIKETFDY